MKIKKFFAFIAVIIFLAVAVFLFAGDRTGRMIKVKNNAITEDSELLKGLVGRKVTVEYPLPTDVLLSPTKIPPTPSPVEYNIVFNNSPETLTEGGNATFTWTVSGPEKTIHKSTVYFGSSSTKGILSKDTAPADTSYTESVKDFIQGDFAIPMRFVGNAAIAKAGTYYSRAYALIDSGNYWSEEKTFTVKTLPVAGYEIKIVNFPQKVKLNDNTSFTWEITGPQSTTGFTAIVGEKVSKSGKLDETVDLSKTPYRILVKEFTGGTYNIPLRYVGNAIMPEYGKYYIRALTVVNGKNIWSDEYSLTVE